MIKRESIESTVFPLLAEEVDCELEEGGLHPSHLLFCEIEHLLKIKKWEENRRRLYVGGEQKENRRRIGGL